MLHRPPRPPGPSTHLGSRGHHGRTTLAFSSGLGVTFLSPSRGHTGCLRPPPSPRPPHPKACLPPSQPVPPLVSLPTLLHWPIPAPAWLPPHGTAAGGSSGTVTAPAGVYWPLQRARLRAVPGKVVASSPRRPPSPNSSDCMPVPTRPPSPRGENQGP